MEDLAKRTCDFLKLANRLGEEIENLKILHRMDMRGTADAKRAELIMMFESYLDQMVELDTDLRKERDA